MVSSRRILQALYYIQSKCNNLSSKYNIMYLLKMMFFADRYHIRHFGFVASGDNYVAMLYGPVASKAKDILEGKILHPDVAIVKEYEVEIAQQKDDELSKSFIKSLDFAIKVYGSYDKYALSCIAHDYPEWKKHETAIKRGTEAAVPMDFKDFFDNPETLQYSKKYEIEKDPFAEDKDFLQALKDDFSGQSSC